MSSISVVIPVYKSRNILPELYRRLVNSLEKIGVNFEIIFVEDCGEDGSWQYIVNLASEDHRVKGLQFSRNFGQHYGITAGLDQSEGDWVVVMDCDLQDRPEEIEALYNKAKEGNDVVVAKRSCRNDRFLKRILTLFFYKIFRYLSGVDYDSDVGNFRIISRKVVNSICGMREQLRFFGGLMSWLGYPSVTIIVKHDVRYEGKSSYSFKKLFKLAAETIIAYSDKPLTFFIRFGFFISLMSFTYGAYLIYRWVFHGSPIQGWSSLIVSIYLLGGVVISMLGILGIYLGKTFDETKNRPLYIVNNTTFPS